MNSVFAGNWLFFTYYVKLVIIVIFQFRAPRFRDNLKKSSRIFIIDALFYPPKFLWNRELKNDFLIKNCYHWIIFHFSISNFRDKIIFRLSSRFSHPPKTSLHQPTSGRTSFLRVFEIFNRQKLTKTSESYAIPLQSYTTHEFLSTCRNAWHLCSYASVSCVVFRPFLNSPSWIIQ